VNVSYEKADGSWWCNSHKRPATHVRIKDDGSSPERVCDPNLGGILLPCDCVRIENREEWLMDTPEVRGYDGKTLGVYIDEKPYGFLMHVREESKNGIRREGFVQLVLEPNDLEAALHFDAVIARLKKSNPKQ